MKANPERILAIPWQSVVDGGGDEVQEETGSCRRRRIGGAYTDIYLKVGAPAQMCCVAMEQFACAYAGIL